MEKAIKQFQAVVGVVDRKQEQLMKHEKSLVGKAKVRVVFPSASR